MLRFLFVYCVFLLSAIVAIDSHLTYVSTRSIVQSVTL